MTQKIPDILKRIVARKCEEIDESIGALLDSIEVRNLEDKINIIIFEGILSLYEPEIRKLMNMKI